jgi:CRISPR-associated protein Csb2
MPTVHLRFPARRYHATPWGYHVNEGQIEWPPSPWRLLRALISTGYATMNWPGGKLPSEARSLFQKLASVLPRYNLPRVVGAHTRHFMPLARIKSGREEPSLVFDTWAQIDDGAISITWDVELNGKEITLLSSLCERLGYLGRSESWVIARIANDTEIDLGGDECFPCSSSPLPPGRSWEQVPVMVPMTAEKYEQWKAAVKKSREPEDLYPEDFIECLKVSTDWLRKHGWSQPPGSERVFYWRRSDSLETSAPITSAAVMATQRIEAILLSVSSSSGNDHALPPVSRALSQAALLHRALVSVTTQVGFHSEALTGCDINGKPLGGPHRHAHILSLDLDADGHIDHMLIWTPMGLGYLEQDAVRAVRRTFTKGGIHPLRIAIAGMGSLKELAGLPGVEGERLRAVLGSIDPEGKSEVWRSVTPFVPPRHLKKRGRNTLAGQVASELEVRGFPLPKEVRIIDPHTDDEARRQRHFITRRNGAAPPPVDCRFTLELHFETPVQGPICLGYGSHYGLGLFARKSAKQSAASQQIVAA